LTWKRVGRSLLIFIIIAGGGTAPAVRDTSAASACDSVLTLPGWDEGTASLTVPVPAGYSTRMKKGDDFDVHFLEPMSPSEGTGSIYVGHHPNPFHRQVERTGEVAERKETIGGELVSVYEFVVNNASRQRIVREAVLTNVFADISHDKRLAELRVHISASASTPEEADRLWQCISRVRHE
jgi:hypothetical protein